MKSKQRKKGECDNENNDPMLSIREMAELTGVSVHYLYHYKNQHGKLPWDSFLVTATKRVARKSDVLAWLEAVRIPAGEATDRALKREKEVMPIT
ncbi:MAG: helix-turn-helix domain-containing protein [Treponema sp.]|jgi:predicted DNA-binding transcriptional regulator AlpA|nr:helix-turn-helix domain-containing protein [Treponema sp.]